MNIAYHREKDVYKVCKHVKKVKNNEDKINCDAEKEAKQIYKSAPNCY